MGPLDLVVEELCFLKVAFLLNMTGTVLLIDELQVSTEIFCLFFTVSLSSSSFLIVSLYFFCLLKRSRWEVLLFVLIII